MCLVISHCCHLLGRVFCACPLRFGQYMNTAGNPKRSTFTCPLVRHADDVRIYGGSGGAVAHKIYNWFGYLGKRSSVKTKLAFTHVPVARMIPAANAHIVRPIAVVQQSLGAGVVADVRGSHLAFNGRAERIVGPWAFGLAGTGVGATEKPFQHGFKHHRQCRYMCEW